MDAITGAIVSAVSAGLGRVGNKAVVDAYNGIKSLIVKKFGQNSDLAEAVEKVEQKPDSKGRQTTLQEEVEAAQADKDSEFVVLARELIKALESTDEGKKVLAKYHIEGSQVGVVGDYAEIKDAIHFGNKK